MKLSAHANINHGRRTHNSRMLPVFFQTHGNLIHEESNGADGLITLGQFDFDLVVSDICMPILDGIGFLKVARLRFPALPIIMVSGGSRYTPEEILSFGASGFLDKMEMDPEKIQNLAEAWTLSQRPVGPSE
ncbi:MAG: response regulator [Bdellovibrionales bacterium]